MGHITEDKCSDKKKEAFFCEREWSMVCSLHIRGDSCCVYGWNGET
jgi:hypothetical protein